MFCMFTFSKSVVHIGSIETNYTKKLTFKNEIHIQWSKTGTTRSGLLYLKRKHQKDLAKCAYISFCFATLDWLHL